MDGRDVNEPMNIIEACARAAHEANLVLCIAAGDSSQKPWTEAEEWQRKSAREGVAIALAGSTPEQQHVAWCDAKIKDGWKYGDVKDASAKTHPRLVPYASLPPHQQAKDAVYIAVVQAVAKALG
jgi:hypothetical protein